MYVCTYTIIRKYVNIHIYAERYIYTEPGYALEIVVEFEFCCVNGGGDGVMEMRGGEREAGGAE